MRTETNVFDGKMPLVTYSTVNGVSGACRALVCVNERMEEVMTEDGESGSVHYLYDTVWVDAKSQSEQSVKEAMRRMLMDDVTAYDKSDRVNGFTLQGKRMWLDKEMRVGLVNSIGIEKSAGKEETVLWFECERYVIPVDKALQMLAALELYALACYNVTAQHMADVADMDDIKAMINYDVTKGYPAQPVFEM